MPACRESPGAQSLSRRGGPHRQQPPPAAGFHAASSRSCLVSPRSNPLRGTWKLRSAKPSRFVSFLPAALCSPHLKPSRARTISVRTAPLGGGPAGGGSRAVAVRPPPAATAASLLCMLLCPEPQDRPADGELGAQEAGEVVQLEAVSACECRAHAAPDLGRTTAAGLGVGRPQAPGAALEVGGRPHSLGLVPPLDLRSGTRGISGALSLSPTCLSVPPGTRAPGHMLRAPQSYGPGILAAPSTHAAHPAPPAQTSYSRGLPHLLTEALGRTHSNFR